MRIKTQLKNRIHGVLLRHNLSVQASDLFGDQGRAELLSRGGELPPWSRESVLQQLRMVDSVENQLRECEKQLEAILYPNVERDLLKTAPGVGKVLSAVIALEIGDVRRFSEAKYFASYSGLVPSARESAERKRQGKCPRDSNLYLKWAFVEAANIIAGKQKGWPECHAVQLYQRVKHNTKMHGKAAVAVARHLAEASYWMLKKQEDYREPKSKRQVLSSTHG